MAKAGGTLRNILVWTFERGTLQYDIICALILAFIFFVPRSCFTARHTDESAKPPSVQANQQPAPNHQTVKNSRAGKSWE